MTLHRVDGDIETTTDITVVPGDSAEVRRVTLTNTASEARDIELTSYGEVVMAPPASDVAHPAFGKLFVETEWLSGCSALLARRRRRAEGDPALMGPSSAALGAFKAAARLLGLIDCAATAAPQVPLDEAAQPLGSAGPRSPASAVRPGPRFCVRRRGSSLAGLPASCAI